MNCCDEYGNCRQGRDCPVRIARSQHPSILKHQLKRLAYWLLIYFFGLLWLVFLVTCASAYA